MKYKMEDPDEKRDVHPVLKQILSKDIAVTNFFLDKTNNITVFRSLRNHHRFLEVSCHGIFWLFICISSIWLFGDQRLYQLQINLLIALLVDIVLIAVLKAITRRRRPSPSSDIGPDKFSFPSGHASRAALIVFILMHIYSLSIIFYPPMLAWLTTVSISRVVAKRHYLLDVVAGLLIGLMQGIFMSLIWLSPESCLYLVSWLSDEKISGGEYHV